MLNNYGSIEIDIIHTVTLKKKTTVTIISPQEKQSCYVQCASYLNILSWGKGEF